MTDKTHQQPTEKGAVELDEAALDQAAGGAVPLKLGGVAGESSDDKHRDLIH